MSEMTKLIDGSLGEGGGQILRTSLSMSLLTGTAIRIERIRAGRRRSGLLRQHLTAVRAAAAISNAEVSGAALGAQELALAPRAVLGGDYHFAVGTAGSATLVLQTVLPPLLVADSPSRVVVEGGTHNPFAPPYHFLERCFAPALKRMGANVELKLERAGFYPAGGGRIVATVEPIESGRGLTPLVMDHRGPVIERRVHAIVANLPNNIGHREGHAVRTDATWADAEHLVESVASPGPGNALMLELVSAGASELITGFGERGVRAEEVAQRALQEAHIYEAHGAPVGEHLADQLLLPMAVGAGGSFRTGPLSMHTKTNIEVLKRFVDVEITTETEREGTTQVRVER